MRHLLFHPTHRKFIRLLRERVNNGCPIILTQADLDEYDRISQGTVTMLQRHQSIYRIVLSAANRPVEEIDKKEKIRLIGERQIDTIEYCFSKAERKHLGAAIVAPILDSIVRRLEKRRRTKRRQY